MMVVRQQPAGYLWCEFSAQSVIAFCYILHIKPYYIKTLSTVSLVITLK